MPLKPDFGTTFELLARSIDLRARNHGVISANIANSDTPGYLPGRISFEGALKGVLKGDDRVAAPPSHPRHIPLGSVAGNELHGEAAIDAEEVGEDGNGVSLEVEMGRMAENQIMYNASVQILAKKFEAMKIAIRGGN